MIYSELYEKAPEGMMIINNDGLIINANEHLLDLLGYNKEEIIQKPLQNLFKEIDANQILKQTVELPIDDTLTLNCPMRKKSGAFLYNQVKFKRISKESLMGVVRDVAVNIEILKQLQNNEENFRQITDHIRDVFFLRDLQTGNVVYVSPSYERIWQRPLSEVYKNPKIWIETIHEEDKARIYDLLKKSKISGSFNMHFRIYRPDGSIRWIKARSYPIFDEHKHLYRAAGVAEDITDEILLIEDNQKLSDHHKHSIFEMIIAIITAFEQRDPYTVGHQNNVSYLSKMIAKEMMLSDEQIKSIEFSALVHDIGKIGIPAEILTKPSSLSELEFELIKTHPKAGYDILKNIQFPWPVADIVLSHHERLDGSGYPQGLRGDEINIQTRIISVADCIDAMLSYRPYHPSLGIKAALANLNEGRGKFFDKEVLKVCDYLLLKKKIDPYLTKPTLLNNKSYFDVS